jgi:hypothetical protein
MKLEWVAFPLLTISTLFNWSFLATIVFIVVSVIVYYLFPTTVLSVVTNSLLHVVSLVLIRIGTMDNPQISLLEHFKQLPTVYYLAFLVLTYLEFFYKEQRELWYGWYFFGANSLGNN